MQPGQTAFYWLIALEKDCLPVPERIKKDAK
jgi:hypothetical protein